MIDRRIKDTGLDDFVFLFRQHLKDHHSIETTEDFTQNFIREHLEGKQTVIPISIFSNKKLTAFEAVIKYLRENEHLTNSASAQIVGRSPAATWIAYRNAKRKLRQEFSTISDGLVVPTSVLMSQLSPLESISMYLKGQHNLSYRKIGLLLDRDERTIWTVCDRARKKLAR